MISKPLKGISKSLEGVDGSVNSLSGRMATFATTMTKVAVGAATLLVILGSTARSAIAFESSMADIAKVVEFETKTELNALGDTILEMSGHIPMASDGIAAIIAAAGQSGIAKNSLAEFAEQAAKMGIAFDLTGDIAGKMMADWRAGMDLTLPRVYALADAVNHLSANMNAAPQALGEVVQRTGPLAMAAGLAEQEVAALGAAFLSAGASPEIASTALRKFTSTLVLGAAMSDRQAQAFENLGFSATQMALDMQTNAQGTIMSVLQSIAKMPKELQVATLTEMFGEMGVGAIAPLLKNMGNLSLAFDLIGNATSYAGSMQKEFEVRSATTANALQLMRNRFQALRISIGTAFLPFIASAATTLGDFASAVRAVVSTPFGQWLLKALGVLSAIIILIPAVAAGIWGIKFAATAAAKAFKPLITFLAGLTLPMWLLIGAFAALYLAYKTNFGGMADAINAWWGRISLIFSGVRAVFSSMKDGVGEIRGELATQIKAQGLVGLVTTISKYFYRIMNLLKGFSSGLQSIGKIVLAILLPPFKLVLWVIGLFADLVGFLTFGLVDLTNIMGASTWAGFGRVLGYIVGVLATGFLMIKAWAVILGVVAVATKAWAVVIGIATAVTKIWAAATLFLNAAFWANPVVWIIAAIVAAIAALVAVIAGAAYLIIKYWDQIKSFFTGLWNGLIAGIDAFFGWVDGAFSSLGNFFAKLWGGIAAGGKKFGGWIKGLFTGLWDIITYPFRKFFDWIGGIWDRVASVFSGKSLWEIGLSLGTSLFDGINSLADGVSGWLGDLWGRITGFFDGLSLSEAGFKLLSTIGDGILSAADTVIDSVTGVFSKIRNLLPFSDAKEGPLSDLTASGAAIMSTLGAGVTSNEFSLIDSVSGVFGKVSGIFDDAVDWLFGSGSGPSIPPPQVGEMQDGATASGRRKSGTGAGQGSTTIHIANISLPGVSDAKGFVEALQDLVASYDGVAQ